MAVNVDKSKLRQAAENGHGMRDKAVAAAGMVDDLKTAKTFSSEINTALGTFLKGWDAVLAPVATDMKYIATLLDLASVKYPATEAALASAIREVP